MEEFFDIPGFEGFYQMNRLGVVKRLPLFVCIKGEYIPYTKENILSHVMAKRGYPMVFLCTKGKIKYCYIHRLMAEMFIPNLGNKKEINHKDGNKANFHIENLEWATSSENQRHAVENGLAKFLYADNHPQSKANGGMRHIKRGPRGEHPTAKLVLDTETGIFYDCVADAADAKWHKNINLLYSRLNGQLKNTTSLRYV